MSQTYNAALNWKEVLTVDIDTNKYFKTKSAGKEIRS
jgi:hypothetical protein